MSRAAIAEGQAHLMAGRLNEAQAIYHRALESEPNTPHVPARHNNHGDALQARGRGEEDPPLPPPRAERLGCDDQ